MREEELQLKQWLRAVFPADMSRQAMADELGVTRRTISNLLSPEAGWGNGLTMLRYLQVAGVVTEAPTASSRLATLEETVYRTGAATAEALADLAVRLQRVEKLLAPPTRRAKAG